MLNSMDHLWGESQVHTQQWLQARRSPKGQERWLALSYQKNRLIRRVEAAVEASPWIAIPILESCPRWASLPQSLASRANQESPPSLVNQPNQNPKTRLQRRVRRALDLEASQQSQTDLQRRCSRLTGPRCIEPYSAMTQVSKTQWLQYTKSWGTPWELEARTC